MSGVNKVILLGYLGKDPETYTFSNGNKKVRLTIATSEAYKNKAGERVEHTEWHYVNMFRSLADVAEKYLKKGNLVYVEGMLRTRSWEEANGEKRYITEIEGHSLNMLGGSKGKTEASLEKGKETPPSIPNIPKDVEDGTEENFYDPSQDAMPF